MIASLPAERSIWNTDATSERQVEISTNHNDPASQNCRRTIVLVGMMGAGKSAVGRRLAARLRLPFLDSDAEIERAAGLSVAEIFARHGEAEFRAGERRVIARLLVGPVGVLSTGGGAFMDAATRDLVRRRALSVWLRVDPVILTERATRRSDRPLLKDVADPLRRMTDLLAQRAPIYAEADLAVESDDRPVDDTVERVLKALEARAAQVES